MCVCVQSPEIRKYKRKFSSEILCGALWGVNLLVGTDGGLMLLDRSGHGKVFQLINRRRFQQIEVLEGLNILVCISGEVGWGGHTEWGLTLPPPTPLVARATQQDASVLSLMVA